MLRRLYSLLLYLLVPVAFLLETVRGWTDPAWRGRFRDRFALAEYRRPGGIWLHAVSMGEMQAAAPLLRDLAGRHPHIPLVLTTVTPTGAARARQLFGATVELHYLPFDLPGAARRFCERVQPRLAIILETELWPNLYAACRDRKIPLVIANARLSQRSVSRYRRFASLLRELFAGDVVIAAQSTADAERFLALGASPARTEVTGNIKFDVAPEVQAIERGRLWRRQAAPDRPLWVAGSTHEGEETLLLEAHELLRQSLGQALLVLVPRHPTRFEVVAAMLEHRGIAWQRHSDGAPLAPGTAVLLGDTMGELVQFYAAADAAFVGGSLVPVGGHNLLEPAALGVPVLTGPHQFNAAEVYRRLDEAGGVITVAANGELAAALQPLLTDEAARRLQGERALQVIEQNRGALERLRQRIESLLGGING